VSVLLLRAEHAVEHDAASNFSAVGEGVDNLKSSAQFQVVLSPLRGYFVG